MTNSLSLSPTRKLILIHGLNNNESSFDSMALHLERLGFAVIRITLPNHGQDRFEADNFENAKNIFSDSMKALGQEPMVAVAFSQGALFLQNWMCDNPDHSITSQVLLAPALKIVHQNKIQNLINALPGFMWIKSFTPSRFRKYSGLWFREYQILLNAIEYFKNQKEKFPIKTKIFIDPKDELVDASFLIEELMSFKNVGIKRIDRPYIRGIGAHHILFHEEYFKEDEWTQFLKEIESFLKEKY